MRFLSEKYKKIKYFHWYSQSSLPLSKGNWAKPIVLESESGIFLFKMPKSFVHFPIALQLSYSALGCFTPELVERSKVGKTDGNRKTWYLGLGRYVTSGIKFSLCNFLDFRRHMWEDWCWQWCWSMPRNWPQLDGCTWLSGLEWNLHCNTANHLI